MCRMVTEHCGQSNREIVIVLVYSVIAFESSAWPSPSEYCETSVARAVNGRARSRNHSSQQDRQSSGTQSARPTMEHAAFANDI